MAYDINNPSAQMLQGDLAQMPPLEDVFSVKGKAAIVTGGSSGLGFNVTARLLQGGANVVMASFSETERDNALGVLEEAGYGPDRVQFCLTNVTNEEDLQKLIAFTDETFGSIDILVTCAATWSYAQIYNLPKAEFEKAVGVNLT
ncbi:MAG: SDR family NAD(P)-dependent oxidoreductase, partial [Clostridia bacterium]|nr:SDR family NAD(P)-dependent oxidoreductase [Clostridia bacterium]